MQLCSKLQIKIYYKNFLSGKKIVNKIIMPIKNKEVMWYKSFKFIIAEIFDDRLVVDLYKEDLPLHCFVLPTIKKCKFTLAELEKYNFTYSKNGTDNIFEIRVEGIK